MLTVLLLTQQAIALGVAGVLVCCQAGPPQATAKMECCENGGDGHMCPLRRPASDDGCRIRNGCNTAATGVLVGAGFVYAAPLVERFSIVPPDAQRTTSDLELPPDPFCSLPPPTPPPKP